MRIAIYSVTLSFALCCLCGCSAFHEPLNGLNERGSLAVRVTSLNGMIGDKLEARIYIDGRFVGDCQPDETLLSLSIGRHRVRLELPEVHQLRTLPNGDVEDRSYRLSGEECVEILGVGTKQVVNFGAHNMKRR
ncbi:MAG: hypothetical protein IT581_02210 [Verrucomicrobiales bacterium]|nr:hypothetical protein [Verrucomicrobiales bacterium]